MAWTIAAVATGIALCALSWWLAGPPYQRRLERQRHREDERRYGSEPR